MCRIISFALNSPDSFTEFDNFAVGGKLCNQIVKLAGINSSEVIVFLG